MNAYIVSDMHSLERLKKDKNLYNSIRKIKLELTIPGVESYSMQINKYYFSCGCEQGAIAVFASILIVTVIYLTTEVPILEKWWYGGIYLVVGGLLGKIYGIIYKKFMLHNTIKALKQELHLRGYGT